MQDRVIYLIAAAVALCVGIVSYSLVLGRTASAVQVAGAPAGQATPGLGSQLAFLGSTVNSLANDPNAPIPNGMPATLPPAAAPGTGPQQVPGVSPASAPAPQAPPAQAPGAPAASPAASPGSAPGRPQPAPSPPAVEVWDKLPGPTPLPRNVQ